MEAVYFALAYSAEYPVAKPFVVCFQIAQKLFHVFSLGCVIFWALALAYRQREMSDKMLDVLFFRVYKRSYNTYIADRQIRDRGKAAKPPFKK